MYNIFVFSLIKYILLYIDFRMSNTALISIYYQNKNYIGLDRIMTFTFGQFMGKN